MLGFLVLGQRVSLQASIGVQKLVAFLAIGLGFVGFLVIGLLVVVLQVVGWYVAVNGIEA